MPTLAARFVETIPPGNIIRALDQSLAVSQRSVQQRLTPDHTQKITLIVAGVYVVAIAILW
jgi:hypothetical protein